MASPKQNYLVAFFALTTVVAAGAAWQLNRKLHELQLASQQAIDDRATWQKQLAAAEKRSGELETELAALRENGPGNPSPSVEAEPSDRPGPRGPRDFRGNPGRNLAALLDDPEFAKAWSTQQKAQLDNRYADLFRKLNLSPEQLEKFKSLLVEKQTAMMDVMAAARAEGINGREGRDQLRQLVQQTQAELDESIQAMLGDAGYAQYKGYEQTMPQRNTVNQLEQRLSYGGTPLSDAQADQLVQILAETSPRRSSGTTSVVSAMGPQAAMFFGGSNSITDAAITRAQGVLSTDQVAALQQLQAEQQAQRQISDAFRNAGRTSQSTSNGAKVPGGG
ncbi:MAG TPA: hypothetical protein VGD81_02995 [Opitutaceae bacterium]